MTGPEHYREAERHLSAASFLDRPGGTPVNVKASAHHVAAAQAHATLALAAATALPAGEPGSESRAAWIRSIHRMEQHNTPEEAAS